MCGEEEAGGKEYRFPGAGVHVVRVEFKRIGKISEGKWRIGMDLNEEEYGEKKRGDSIRMYIWIGKLIFSVLSAKLK